MAFRIQNAIIVNGKDDDYPVILKYLRWKTLEVSGYFSKPAVEVLRLGYIARRKADTTPNEKGIIARQ